MKKIERKKSQRLFDEAMTAKEKEIMGSDYKEGGFKPVVASFIINQLNKYGESWLFGDKLSEFEQARKEENEEAQKIETERLLGGWVGEPYDIIAFKPECNGVDGMFSIGFRVDNESYAWFEYVLHTHGEKGRVWTTDQWYLGDVEEQRLATKDEVLAFLGSCNENLSLCVEYNGEGWRINKDRYKEWEEHDSALMSIKHSIKMKSLVDAGLSDNKYYKTLLF